MHVAPGCMQTGPRRANTVLQIMGGFQTMKQIHTGRRWFCLHSFRVAHPDLQGEGRSTQENTKAFSSAGIASGTALAREKLDFTLQRRQVQRSPDTRCVGPSTGFCVPTDPLQDSVCSWLRAGPSVD